MKTEHTIIDTAGYKSRLTINRNSDLVVGLEFQSMYPNSIEKEWVTNYHLTLPEEALENLRKALL